jgi:beta-galactosidase
MQAFVRRLDPTRRVVYPNSGWGHGISEVMDVMGFNYIFNGDIDKQHAAFPDQPSIGTEETTSRGTRGVYEDDKTNAHLEATDRKPAGRSLETGFKFYAARPFLSGLFYWTGFDYRGEPNPFGWPQVASQSGIIDMCGFPKDMFFFLKSWWTETPVLRVFPHWTWDKGKTVSVWAYSSCDEVELFLNEKSLGRKAMQKHGHLEWSVAYKPGSLLARGYRDGKEVVSDRVETAGEPATINLVPDRAIINADGEDVSIISVEVRDAHGRIVPTASDEITFMLEGPGRIIGVGNGDPSSHEPDKYIDRVNQVTIQDLKAIGVQQKESYPETLLGFDDAAWPSLLNNREEYGLSPGEGMQRVVIRGSLDLPDLNSNSVITLWPKSLGEEQAVYVNGHLIAQNIKRDDALQAFKLDPEIVHSGKNIYAVVGTPFVRRYQYDNLNTDPGVIQVFTPAEPWRRKAFNGAAQVIVQSGKNAGELLLRAAGRGLSGGVVRVGLQHTALRPTVTVK